MARVPTPIDLVERLRDDLGSLLEVLLFLALSILAVASIVEIAARVNYLGYLQDQIQAGNQQLVEYETTADTYGAPPALLQQLKGRLQSLISVGADDPGQTLIAIRYDLEEAEAGVQLQSAARSRGYYTLFSPLYWVQGYYKRLSSDFLLAIAIMTCGAIGASLAAIRTNKRFSWRSLLFGLSSGFIVFLAIKGGKHVFLLNAQGQTVQFNPYSSGFAGLLAGMFTEKTFELLALVTNVIFNKVKKVVEE